MKRLPILAATGCTILLTGLCASKSRGWDSPGHMSVAGVAFDLLTSAEQNKLVSILLTHRDVARLKAGLNTQQPKGRDLVMAAATWPDLIKEDTSYKNNGYIEKGPITQVKDDMLMHKGWHFIDKPLGRDATKLPKGPGPTTVDAVTVVNRLMVQLKSGESDSQKAFDLAWLLHIVGDLHQPLHTATGVDSVYPKGDTGGNDILLAGDKHGEPELHAYWDDILGKSAGRDKTTKRVLLDKDVALANTIVASLSTVSLPADKDDIDPQHWANDGYSMAKKDVYHLPAVANRTVTKSGKSVVVEQATLDANYHTVATKDADVQIKAAGYRLAKLLKSVLSSSP